MRPLRLSDVVLDRLISPVNERFWEWSEIVRWKPSARYDQFSRTRPHLSLDFIHMCSYYKDCTKAEKLISLALFHMHTTQLSIK